MQCRVQCRVDTLYSVQYKKCECCQEFLRHLGSTKEAEYKCESTSVRVLQQVWHLATGEYIWSQSAENRVAGLQLQGRCVKEQW